MSVEKAPKKSQDMEIDLLKFAKSLIKYIWLIVLAAVLCGGGTFAYVKTCTVPRYESWTQMYINSSVSMGGAISISGSTISASRSLVSTYSVIIESRTLLEAVIDKAELKDADGNKMSYEELVKKISAADENDTEIIRITVTDTDPQRSMLIANTIAELLPKTISSIIEGTQPTLVDEAIEGKEISSGLVQKTAIGALVGIVLVVGYAFLVFMFDQKIHNEQDLLDMYDLPLLAVVPDLKRSHSKKYGYGKYGKYGKYGNKYAYGYGAAADSARAAEKAGSDAKSNKQ